MSSHETSMPLRILLVEDSDHDFLVFRRAFEKDDVACDIVRYDRAEDVLDRLKTDAASFDLVVSNFKLPGMSGFELFRKLIENKTPLPMVIMIGSGLERLVVEALKIGVDDYIIKDPHTGYSDLLPVVLPDVARKYRDYAALLRTEEALRKSEAEKSLLLNKARHELELRARERTAEHSKSNKKGRRNS